MTKSKIQIPEQIAECTNKGIRPTSKRWFSFMEPGTYFKEMFSLNAWCPLKGHTYLNKPAGLFKYL